MIVGLGNPTLKYHHTRHNLGAWYVKLFSQIKNIQFQEKKSFYGNISIYKLQNISIKIFIPNVFMNYSGISIFSVSSFYNIRLNEILVIHDDLDLPPGVIKLKYGYGHNGHNGLRNIISKFGMNREKFCRIRIGIGRPNCLSQIRSFVLSSPTIFERNIIFKVINYVINDIDILINNKKYFITSKLYHVD
ncbi:aminoacyl-tRNA hydrolase [Buchnera aphidicola]|uniref:aminoacyl-tRNA hydrolase n=1 Tax=Buchnera aphidicola TaxID=9 RepID=UPI0034646EC0